MTGLEVINKIISKGANAVPPLDEKLADFAERFPDLAPEIEEYLGEINAAVTPEGLIHLGATVFDELAHFHGLNPRNSPSNLAG